MNKLPYHFIASISYNKVTNYDLWLYKSKYR